MFGPRKALRINLVDAFGARRPRSEPTTCNVALDGLTMAWSVPSAPLCRPAANPLKPTGVSIIGPPSRAARQSLLLVDVDQHSAGHGIPEARAPNLARLKHHIAIGQDGRGSEGVQTLNDVEGERVETIR